MPGRVLFVVTRGVAISDWLSLRVRWLAVGRGCFAQVYTFDVVGSCGMCVSAGAGVRVNVYGEYVYAYGLTLG